MKNLNNITEEMQLEILKREKLDYVFQSLSFISIVPVLCLQPLKNWAISNFAFTKQFYEGKLGLIVQILLILVTFVCYILTRKLKDNGSIRDEYKDPNQVWQMKLYNKNPLIKKIVDLFIPKQDTKEHRLIVKLMKDAASKQKIETLYINRAVICVVTLIVSLLFFMLLHNVARDYVYKEPTSDYDILGEMDEKDMAAAMELTELDNHFIEIFKKDPKTTQVIIADTIRRHEYYEAATQQEIDKAAERIYGKLQMVKGEYMQWFELLLAFLFATLRILCT